VLADPSPANPKRSKPIAPATSQNRPATNQEGIPRDCPRWIRDKVTADPHLLSEFTAKDVVLMHNEPALHRGITHRFSLRFDLQNLVNRRCQTLLAYFNEHPCDVPAIDWASGASVHDHWTAYHTCKDPDSIDGFLKALLT
jgi:hypothetical protein